MLDVGLAEIQKNISLLSRLRGPIKIVDKKRKVDIAMVYPLSHKSNYRVSQIAGKYKKYISKNKRNISKEKAKETAWNEYLIEKYGRSD